MAVDYLSAINRQGSGLNITELVDGLVEAETAPQVDRIQKDIDNRNAAISGYAIVANELGKLKTFTESLSGSSAFSVSSSNSAIGVQVDKSLCIGCCSCETIAPGVFSVDKSSQMNPKSNVYNRKGASNLKILNAAETCPTKAILVDDLTEGKRIFPY